MNRRSCTVLSLLLCFCMFITGCSSEAQQPAPITIDDLPGSLAYGEVSILLSAVSFCEIYAAHGYTGYCVVTVDRSEIDDDDVYWLLNRQSGEIQAEFEINAYLTSEANSLENERMSQLRTTYDSENIYFVFYSKDVHREHLNDFELGLQMIMSPEKDLIAATTQYYYFYLDAEEGVDYSDYDSVLSENEKKVIIDALNDKIDSLS